MIDVNDLAQEIRRVDDLKGRTLNNKQLAEALLPFIEAAIAGSTPAPCADVVGRDSLNNALEMTGCENEENLIDMANVGNSLMERIDSLVRAPGPYHRWSPAEDPAEIVFDLVNDLDDLREDHAKLRDALEQIAGQTGQFAIPFPDGQEGYPAFAVMTARAALAAEGQP